MTVKEAEERYRKIIANNIKRYVDEKGWSAAALARKMNVSNTIVSAWMRGQKKPKDSHIDEMCRLFGCDRLDITEEPAVAHAWHEEQRLRMYAELLAKNRLIAECVELLQDVDASDYPRVREMIRLFKKEKKDEET